MRKFFIVIPTKNRHDTLFYSIKTALAQKHTALEVIVSDNCSTEETKRVVDMFSDSRLRYQRSDSPLAMVNSWEFALSGVKGTGFVHFMGDDNGLLPNAIEKINGLIDATGAKVVHGDVVQYKWPGLDGDAGELSMPLARGCFMVDSRKALANAYKLKIGFARLPTINIAFVHTDVINKAKRINGGKYFCASNPDVYSALLNSYCVKNYCYSKVPFVVNGASSHSNGGTTQKSQGVSAFVSDNLNDGYVYHPKFPASSSYYLNVYESFAVAAEKFASQGDFFSLPIGKLCNSLIRKEYVGMRRPWLKRDIEDFVRRNELKISLPEVHGERLAENIKKSMPVVDMSSGENIFFRGDDGFLMTVFDAAKFSQILENSMFKFGFRFFIRSQVGRVKWSIRKLLMGADCFYLGKNQ